MPERMEVTGFSMEARCVKMGFHSPPPRSHAVGNKASETTHH